MGEYADLSHGPCENISHLVPHPRSASRDVLVFVVGSPGKFVAVQVKCTIAKQQNAKGYICNLKSKTKRYRAGSFDFVAAYAILVDTWYIVPEKAIRGLGAICLCSTMPKYEWYREAWHLLRKATGSEESHFSQNQGDAPPQGHPRLLRTLLAKSARNGAPEVSGVGEEAAEEPVSEVTETPVGPGLARMQGAMNYFRNYLEKGGRAPR
jgi:hypothetical protein